VCAQRHARATTAAESHSLWKSCCSPERVQALAEGPPA
jgi:hypothetical protein